MKVLWSQSPLPQVCLRTIIDKGKKDVSGKPVQLEPYGHKVPCRRVPLMTSDKGVKKMVAKKSQSPFRPYFKWLRMVMPSI